MIAKTIPKENDQYRIDQSKQAYLPYMFDLFELPVQYKGKEMLFPAELLPMGFTHKIKVNIEGTDILFEPDEERNYRAVITQPDLDKMPSFNKELLQLICQTLDELFGNGDQSSIQQTD